MVSEGFDFSDCRDVLAQVEASVAAAGHLTEMDAGAVASALSFARLIQDALDSVDASRADKLMYGPYASLSKILNDLGLTPQGRVNLGLMVSVAEDDEEF